MAAAQRAPGGPISYYSDLLDKLIKERQQSADDSYDNLEIEELASDDDINELTRYLLPTLILVVPRFI